jgi:hypothetical protein
MHGAGKYFPLKAIFGNTNIHLKNVFNWWLELGLLCLMSLSTIFQLYVYHGSQFYWKREFTIGSK